MNFTDEQIEEAARILCEMRGKLPDDVTDFSTVKAAVIRTQTPARLARRFPDSAVIPA